MMRRVITAFVLPQPDGPTTSARTLFGSRLPCRLTESAGRSAPKSATTLLTGSFEDCSTTSMVSRHRLPFSIRRGG